MSEDKRLKGLMYEAQKKAESDPDNILAIARTYFPGIKGNGTVTICPFCGEKGGKFVVQLSKDKTHLVWGCYRNSCPASFDNIKKNPGGDITGLIAQMEGKSREDAIDRLLDLAGVQNPKRDYVPNKKKPAAKKTAATRKHPAPEPEELDPDLEKAISEASNHRSASLMAIARRFYPDIRQDGVMEVCPKCGIIDRSNKFVRIDKNEKGESKWSWGCSNKDCAIHTSRIIDQKMDDAIGMISKFANVPRTVAIEKLLEFTGVSNPTSTTSPPKNEKIANSEPTVTPEAPTAQPAPTEIVINPDENFSLTADPDEKPVIPAPQTTVWDDLYSRLSLSIADRESLKKKRGLNKESIEAAGYRSSSGDNRTALAPLLTSYSMPLLLSEGIAVKDKETGQTKINSQLCGYGLVSRASGNTPEKWDWCNPILIPYRDKQGRCIGIRPHKGGLSGKNYMREHGFEHAFRSSRTRTHLYTSFLFWGDRPEGWERKCVLTEGEHKANALAQCGIPACAVPGIQMARNEIFAEEMFSILREAGIREVIVAFDNEDKSHKADPWDRYDVEVYALYTCHVLRGNGFLPSICTIPEDWRIDGKADWDGALAKFGASSEGKFKSALRKSKPYFPQTEIFGTNERDRIVHCKFNRLTLKPQILTGGDEEEDLAKLILKAPLEWKRELGIRDLAELLFNSRNCYYVHQRPPKEILVGKGRGKTKEPGLYDFAAEIRADLEAMKLNSPDELEQIAGMEAALAAVNILIKGRPEILSDFTISCEFQVRTQEGIVHRLFRFRNKHGQVSDLVQVPPSATSGAMKFREFATGVGNFNAMLGDKHLQMLMQDLGTFSAWREIRELEMLGRDPDSGLWIFGDSAFSPDADLFAPPRPDHSDVIFADKHDIIWHNGIGYRIDPRSLAGFVHKEPPRFFKELGKQPQEVFAALKANPGAERLAVANIFIQYCADMICTFGDSAGVLVIGAVLAYATSPELIAKYHGQPGIWIHGRGGAGKTETTSCAMMTWGFDRDYRTFMLTGGTTAVAIDRALAQHCDIPLHADEFRQDEVNKDRISSLRAPFNRQSKAKGKMDGTNKTRAVQPMTSPIVTGEGVTNDSATLSRYVSAILAADKRLGTKDQQAERFLQIQARANQLHRIVRYILLNRKSIASAFMETLDQFVADETVIKNIHVDRLRLTYGTAFSMVTTMLNHFNEAIWEAVAAAKSAGETPNAYTSTKEDLKLVHESFGGLREFTINYAKEAAADVTSINFVVKFWKDVVTYCNIPGATSIRKFIWFEWCKVDPETNKITRTTAKQDTEGLTRCILFRGNEVFAEYEKEHRQRGKEPELTLSVIRAEMAAEAYWIPAPKHQKRQAHRLSFENHDGQLDVWALNWHKMSPAVQQIFSEQFEKEDYGDDDPMPQLSL
jgi:hypothetical protein